MGEQQMGEAPARFELEVLAGPFELRERMVKEAKVGLGSRPRALSPRWLYDERGSRLFEEITRVEEYYPTRREREILERRAGAVAALAQADSLLELGSGASVKTRLLLGAMRLLRPQLRYVPFDISAPMLRSSGASLAASFPGLEIHAVVGDFEHHLGALPRGGRRLVAFLGGTVGNLDRRARARFFGEISRGLEPQDSFLLGFDLLKDRARLLAAYDDPGGVTAAFNLNVLSVLNRELGADFDPEGFVHKAVFDEAQGRIEMLLCAREDQQVRVEALGLSLHFAGGEALQTEISCKFTVAQMEAELWGAGLVPRALWTDRAGDFAVTLASLRARVPNGGWR